MKSISVIALAAALAGCASPKYNYTPLAKAFSEPPIGSIAVASVGDKMLSQGVLVKQDVLEVLSSFQLSVSQNIGDGLYLKTGDDESAEYFTPKLGDRGGKLTRTSILFDAPSSLMLKKDGGFCVVTITAQTVCGAPGRIERKQIDLITERTLQQTLIYSGKIGNKINVGYREFTSDTARMAFNNNVEYDLSESKTIGYKGAQVEIIEATNRDIKYRVISNFNASK